MNTEQHQIGDGTAVYAPIAGAFLSKQGTLLIDQARRNRMRVTASDGERSIALSVPVDRALEKLLETLIVRSGRTDLHLVIDEPPAAPEGPTPESDLA